MACRKLRLICAALVACWSLPGSAICAIAFVDPSWSPPSLPSGPLRDPIAVEVVLNEIFWVILPVILLVVGIAHLSSAVAGWRWPAAWISAVAAGIALDALGSFALARAREGIDTPPSWYGLPMSIGFVVIGAAMIAVLTGAARSRARED
jgi:hypothetical protein